MKEARDGKTEKREQRRKDIQRQQNNENEKEACESHLSEVKSRLPTLTHLTDTLNISHWTINGPISCVCACVCV